MEVPSEDDKDSGTGEFLGEGHFDLEEMEPQVSINAMNGVSRFHTMRINNHLIKKTLHVLIDSESTRNFLDVGLANKLGCKMEPITMQAITIVDGNQLQCKYVCKNFSWKMHRTQFVSDMLLIPLGGLM